jgi:hypothetical protein
MRVEDKIIDDHPIGLIIFGQLGQFFDEILVKIDMKKLLSYLIVYERYPSETLRFAIILVA